MNNELARFHMIEQQIRTWDVLDPQVIDLLSVIPREEFVPAHLRNVAYADTELNIGGGQVMLAPKIQARMVQDLHIQKSESVLEIGCGTGYSTALLAHRGRNVDAVDIRPDMVKATISNLQNTSTHNVNAYVGNGALHQAFQTYDVIVFSGGMHSLPDGWKSHLRVGGRIFAIVGEDPIMRATIITRTAEDVYETIQPWDTYAPLLDGFPREEEFNF